MASLTILILLCVLWQFHLIILQLMEDPGYIHNIQINSKYNNIIHLPKHAFAFLLGKSRRGFLFGAGAAVVFPGGILGVLL